MQSGVRVVIDKGGNMITGDLVFTQIGSSTNAISSVTEGYHGARVNHVGVVVETQVGKFVLEAFPPEVRLTKIPVHLNRSKNSRGKHRYLLARLKSQYRSLIPEAIKYGLQQRDVPYDRRYLTGEEALYCSELVVDMFKYANDGTEFFKERPMSFRSTETGELLKSWIRYYEIFGMDVPENEPGSNPGDISKDTRLNVYEIVGNITGYKP